MPLRSHQRVRVGFAPKGERRLRRGKAVAQWRSYRLERSYACATIVPTRRLRFYKVCSTSYLIV